MLTSSVCFHIYQRTHLPFPFRSLGFDIYVQDHCSLNDDATVELFSLFFFNFYSLLTFHLFYWCVLFFLLYRERLSATAALCTHFDLTIIYSELKAHIFFLRM